jgi:heme oxygenase
MLRDLIHDNHSKAEKHRFTTLLLSGTIPKEIYADYLYSQFRCYAILEERASSLELLNDLEGIERSIKIFMDFEELDCGIRIYDSVEKYSRHILTLDKEQLLAHIYVRHFGDMYGGQMIKKVIPGSGKMYEFEDRQGLIDKIRPLLSDDLADEANKCFDFILGLFDEIADEHGIQEVK